MKRPRYGAVVVRPHLTWLGAVDDPDHPTHLPTASWAYTEWGHLVEVVATWCKPSGEGIVLVHGGPLADPMAGRQRRALGDYIVKSLGEAGWKTTDAGIETGWFLCQRGDRVPVMLGIGPWIRQDRTSLFGVGLSEPASVVAKQLALYQRALGVSWRGTGGLSGCALLRAIKAGTRERTGGEPLWRWDNASDVCGSSFELLAARHSRPAAPDEAGMWVHQFDVRAMYLAAAMNAELAWSAPQEEGPGEFDPTRPGYWLVRGDMEDPLNLLCREPSSHLQWVTTPVMAYWQEIGWLPQVQGRIIAERQSRIMREWSERLRDARQYAPEELLPAIKDTYARTVGMFRRPGGRIYRPDWRDTIIDLAKINMLRKIRGAGMNPLRYQTDSIWVTSTNPHGRELFPDKGNIGALRFEETLSMDDYLKKYEAAK